MDNGPEFVSKIASEWSQMQEIDFQYIQTGIPTQNAFVERFNGAYRRGVLNKHLFEDLNEERANPDPDLNGRLQRKTI